MWPTPEAGSRTLKQRMATTAMIQAKIRFMTTPAEMIAIRRGTLWAR